MTNETEVVEMHIEFHTLLNDLCDFVLFRF